MAGSGRGGDNLVGSVPALVRRHNSNAGINSTPRASWSSTLGAWSTGRSRVLLVLKELQILPSRGKHSAGACEWTGNRLPLLARMRDDRPARRKGRKGSNLEQHA
ncbi:unnamed protein product [Closterium sp. NIES-53]